MCVCVGVGRWGGRGFLYREIAIKSQDEKKKQSIVPFNKDTMNKWSDLLLLAWIWLWIFGLWLF